MIPVSASGLTLFASRPSASEQKKYTGPCDSNTSTVTWSDLSTEIQLRILKLCSVEVWSNMLLLDKASFNLVQTILYDLFKINPNNLQKPLKEWHPLFFSKPAQKAIKKDAVYKKYLLSESIKKIQYVDYIKTGKLILFRHTAPIIGRNKGAYLALKDFPSLRLGDPLILTNTLHSTATTHLNAAIKYIDGTPHLSKECSAFIIKNLPTLLTQEKPPNIASIPHIPPENIRSGLISACNDYIHAIRNHFPQTHIDRRRNIIMNMLETNMFTDDDIYEGKLHPILWAASNNKIIFLKNFIQAGLNINAQNKKGESGLHIAAKKNRLDIIDIILHGWVDEKTNTHIKTSSHIDIQDKEEKTPLYHASQYGQLATIRYLHLLGADIQAKDINKNTPLHCAAMHGRTEIVEYLLENDVDIYEENSDGHTALYWAAKNGHLNTIALLCKKGLDLKQLPEPLQIQVLQNAITKNNDYVIEHLADNVETLLESKNFNVLHGQKNRALIKITAEKGYQQVANSLQRNVAAQFPTRLGWLGQKIGNFLTRYAI